MSLFYCLFSLFCVFLTVVRWPIAATFGQPAKSKEARLEREEFKPCAEPNHFLRKSSATTPREASAIEVGSGIAVVN
jgi:hypothetical protein